MNIQASSSLAEIVTKNFRAATVFEKYQLDYCCKGKRSLQDACMEKSLALQTILDELQSAEKPNQNPEYSFPFDRLSLGNLIDFIQENHHSFVRRELPRLLSFTEKISSKHGHRHPELNKIHELVLILESDLRAHLDIEDKRVFPKIREMEEFVNNPSGKSIHAIVSFETQFKNLEEDHDKAGFLLGEVRKLTNNFTPPVDACITYKLAFSSLEAFETDLHHHVHLENNLLIPKTLEMYRGIIGRL